MQVRSASAAGRTRVFAGVAAALLVVFVVSIVIRAPWRGHFGMGDQWVTALALRWLRAWHRDGAWALRFALVESPPTAEFAGARTVFKWSFPGHILFLHGLLEPFGLEPTVERLMRINLGIHFVVALTLAALAHELMRQARPDRPAWAAAAAFHCGAFVLLFPPILYWGQNIVLQDFTIIPVVTFIVTARWLRPGLRSRVARAGLDVGVAAAVFLGTMSDFLLLTLVPYLVGVQLLKARRGQPRPTDRWWATLVLPFVLALVCLALIFDANGQLGLMRWRAGVWTSAGTGLWVAVVVRIFVFGMFLRGHFSDAFGLIGVLALWLAAFRLARPGRVARLTPAARGILLDLLVPSLLFALALASHEAFHTGAAIKYIPFVALAWTVLTPLVILESQPSRRGVYAVVYGLVALLAILPFSSAYREFFPTPELHWDDEGNFLREMAPPTDRVFSPATQIELAPPQRIAIAERRVTQVYGPLDVLHLIEDDDPSAPIALWAPRAQHAGFGAVGAEVIERGPYALARFPASRLRAFLAARPDATLREHVADILHGDLRAGDLTRQPRPIPALRLPGAMHITDTHLATSNGWDRLYWTDDQHVHWRGFQPHARDREILVLGDERYGTDWMGLWRHAETVDETPREWGRFLRGLFVPADASGAFRWHEYDVVPSAARESPALLRARFPAVATWDVYLLLAHDTPVGIALGAADGGTDWVCVVFDDLAVAVHLPDDVTTEWKVRGGTPTTPAP